ncbi:NAD(P)/FAD-dependent oxidoreductase [Streptomyces griseoloalbus]|uniref:NAD(P)/FAD-dependent oxidoreductase n=1 Tax=Streptomyces griseoloalbus TaxID=67303 RepID=UPI0033AC1AC0
MDATAAPGPGTSAPGTATEPDPEIVADLAVVGAGPAGLYAASCAGFRGLSTVLVDALAEPGGQIAALYPEKRIYDVAGWAAVRGRELVGELVAQAAAFDPVWLLGRTATTLTPGDRGGWLVGLDDDGRGARRAGRSPRATRIRAGAVLVTAGLGRPTPRSLPALRPFEGRGVAYHVPRLEEHRGRDVVVVGGGDSAVDWALALAPLAASVTVVHRRQAFRAHEHSVKQMYASGVRVLTDTQVTHCHGTDRVEQVTVEDREGQVTVLPAQAVVAALGFATSLGPLAGWGLATEDRLITVDRAMRTSLPGVYAAGDICTYEGRVPLISVGFGEAATAANHAAVALRPGARLAPEHSTDRDPTPPTEPVAPHGSVASPAAPTPEPSV